MAKARIAPTPSGFLHSGNLLNFIINAQLAGEGGRLLLRIDDLDRARYRAEYAQDIFDKLDRLGIAITEGPKDRDDLEANWSQEHRLGLYAETLERLADHPSVFACACSRKELAAGGHPHGCLEGRVPMAAGGVSWRFNTRRTEAVEVADLARDRPFRLQPHRVIPDFAIRRKNGRPSYQLACVTDDLHFEVTHVGRGRDLLPSTVAQFLVSAALGTPLKGRIQYLHHPLQTTLGGHKLSKSAGHQSRPYVLSEADVDGLRILARTWHTKS